MVFEYRRKYEYIFQGVHKEKIDSLLTEIVGGQREMRAEIDGLKNALNQMDQHQRLALQKIGFIRFNPFERSSGEQSFVLSLLNSHDTGIVVNFIYTRDGLRVYSKQVKEGKGVHFELSEEEVEAINKAVMH